MSGASHDLVVLTHNVHYADEARPEITKWIEEAVDSGFVVREKIGDR